MHGAVFGTLVAVAAVILIVGVGASPVVFVPLLLLATLLLLVPVYKALLNRTTFRRDTGAPSTRDASYDPVNRP